MLRIHIPRKILIPALALMAGGALLVTASTLWPVNVNASILGENTSPTSLTNEKSDQTLFASLTGFQPGAKVSYSILGSMDEYAADSAYVDEFGNLSLPLPQSLHGSDAKISYNFVVDQNNGSVNLILTHDTATGKIAVEGQGAREFTRIVIESDTKKIETGSDWAGLFKENDLDDILSTDGIDNLKVAFFNANPAMIQNDAASPSVIQVQMLSGGGGPSGANINQFETSYCGGAVGDDEDAEKISYCDTERIQKTIDTIIDQIITPMQIMAEQLHFNAIHQVLPIGMFMDAKDQLDAQRTIQELTAEANRDYHPSEQMCSLGSYVRDLAKTEEKARNDALAFNKIMMDTYTQTGGTSAADGGEVSALKSRLKQFREVYCNPKDHNGNLGYLCQHDPSRSLANSDIGDEAPGGIGASDANRMNKDIDFFRTLDSKYTLNVDLMDAEKTDDEEDVIALAKNLYWPTALSNQDAKDLLDNKNFYMDTRRFYALQNIAHNTFAHQVAMKAQAVESATGNNAPIPGWAYIKTAMRDFGLNDEQIIELLGDRPSYYAQMDFLTKKLYQNPDFYTNLYDKSANVDRIDAVLQAISLMQQRDHYQNMLRQEMLSSALLQTDLIPTLELIQGNLLEAKTPER